MPWYGWLGWICMLVLGVAILLYFLLRKKQPPNLAEAKLKIWQLEDNLKKAKLKVIEESLNRRKAEKARAEMEMRYLEEKHKEKLENLEGKEKEDYERAKTDPKSGVDFMRDLLGVGSDSS